VKHLHNKLFLTLAFSFLLLPVALTTQLRAEESGAAKTSDTKKSEANENDVYRHSASVQWIARTFHADVETTAKTFELINFAIIVLAIGIPLFRMMPNAFKKRNTEIQKKLVDARTVSVQAQERLSAVETRLTNLDSEIAVIRSQVEADAELDRQRSEQQVQEEKRRIVESAEQEIAAAAAAAQRELKHYAAELALDGAIAQLKLTPETDSELINEFARELGKGTEN